VSAFAWVMFGALFVGFPVGVIVTAFCRGLDNADDWPHR
jgi:hypothetical protein